MKKLLIALLLFSTTLFAQTNNDGDSLVVVKKKYVSSEGLQQATAPGAPSSWIGMGKEIGLATREGLNAVVDTAEKFGSTKVGNFVMIMVAWKIIGRDVLGIVLGIPIMIAGVILWIWVGKRLFFGYQVLTEIRPDKTKVYQTERYEFNGGSDARGAAGVAMFATIVAWLVAMNLIIFAM